MDNTRTHRWIRYGNDFFIVQDGIVRARVTTRNDGPGFVGFLPTMRGGQWCAVAFGETPEDAKAALDVLVPFAFDDLVEEK